MNTHNKKIILYFVTDLDYFVSHRLNLALAANNDNYKIFVLTDISLINFKLKKLPINWVHFSFKKTSLNPIILLYEYFKFLKILSKIKPDIIHSIAIRPSIISGFSRLFKKKPSRIISFSGKGSGYLLKNLFIRQILNFLIKFSFDNSKVIVQNLSDLNFLSVLGLKKSNLILIEGVGVDTDIFYPSKNKNNTPVVLFASRLLRDKGLLEFIAAAQALNLNGIFKIAGKFDLQNPSSLSTEFITDCHNKKIIRYLGYSKNMPLTLREADILCLPSYSEGMPKVILEAMASGLAVIATDIPGCNDVIKNNYNG